jgi:hypothetical protein
VESGECQLYCLQPIQRAPGRLDVIWQFRHRLKHAIRRRVTYLLTVARRSLTKPHDRAKTPERTSPLQPGDRIRVRSNREILETLSAGGDLQGCGFMEGMVRYCGTEQTVLKQMRRFLDETDYHVKRVRGTTYLLEGVMCEGTVDWGPCDRSCLFFWREEWLERLGEPR